MLKIMIVVKKNLDSCNVSLYRKVSANAERSIFNENT